MFVIPLKETEMNKSLVIILISAFFSFMSEDLNSQEKLAYNSLTKEESRVIDSKGNVAQSAEVALEKA